MYRQGLGVKIASVIIQGKIKEQNFDLPILIQEDGKISEDSSEQILRKMFKFGDRLEIEYLNGDDFKDFLINPIDPGDFCGRMPRICKLHELVLQEKHLLPAVYLKILEN